MSCAVHAPLLLQHLPKTICEGKLFWMTDLCLPYTFPDHCLLLQARSAHKTPQTSNHLHQAAVSSGNRTEFEIRGRPKNAVRWLPT